MVYTVREQARQLLGSVSDEILSKAQFTSNNYEYELLQIAATAIAAVVDKWLQDGGGPDQIEQLVYQRVIAERIRQDRKFGPMPRHLSVKVWLAVLMEELGESANEIL